MTNKFVNIKDRVLQVADFSGFGKKNFCEKIGMTYSNFTGKAKNTPLNSTAIGNILTITPDINLDWLITGRGDMLKQNDDVPMLSDKGVPYYDVDFCGGFDIVFNDQTAVPAGYINIPQYNKADSWANITGHSMEPLISNGDIIALHKVDDWQTYLLYGEVYGVMTDEYRTVKRVRKSSNPDKILLEPINKDYDVQEIPRSIITGMWQVIGCAKKLF